MIYLIVLVNYLFLLLFLLLLDKFIYLLDGVNCEELVGNCYKNTV